jgi:glycosyltransferase involved in cell wall biosynthesis
MQLPDTAWARGKCRYELLQYFSAGLPTIASPVSLTTPLVGADRSRLADSSSEWRRALVELLGDADGRRQRGTAARSYVEGNYSYQRWIRDLASLLRSVAD